MDRIRDFGVMIDQAFLRRLIVVWRNAQKTVSPHLLRFLRHMDRIPCAVGACARNHRNPMIHIINAGFDDIQVFLNSQTCRLSGRSADDHRVRSRCNLLLQKFLQLSVINTLIRIHGSDDRYSGTLKYRHNHAPSISCAYCVLYYNKRPAHSAPARRQYIIAAKVCQSTCSRFGQSSVTIHSLPVHEYVGVMLACKQTYSWIGRAYVTETSPTASDISVEDAAYVRSTDGLWHVGGGAVNSNNRVTPLSRLCA